MCLKSILTAGFVAMVAVGAAHANEPAKFDLRNTSGQNIDIIQVSPVSSDDWGPDLLGDRVLRSGGTVTVDPGSTGCMFDVRVTYHSGGKESFRNVDLCHTTRISFANTQNYTMN